MKSGSRDLLLKGGDWIALDKDYFSRDQCGWDVGWRANTRPLAQIEATGLFRPTVRYVKQNGGGETQQGLGHVPFKHTFTLDPAQKQSIAGVSGIPSGEGWIFPLVDEATRERSYIDLWVKADLYVLDNGPVFNE
jgi:hypothetical protein